jgi:hypothetical protein
LFKIIKKIDICNYWLDNLNNYTHFDKRKVIKILRVNIDRDRYIWLRQIVFFLKKIEKQSLKTIVVKLNPG